ncbi:hypothetical protein Ocin01_05400 [Orchesella cincta]|uniref:Uncharacterized protein n=1 Tax=Orchesella cincta TaxID=48709 RepID=A0A1D2N7R1_ORCCI|nr:hypothetical protein Ocin01_05400 [Orchesella cincta]
MTSGSPPSKPLPGDPNPAPPKHTQTQTLIGGGFALVYNFHEFKKSWDACDTDSVCKMEKILLYITIVFGISKPLLLLSDTLENAVNKLWMKLRGEMLIQKNSAWNTSLQFFAMFKIVDQGLSKGWNWVQYATDCLKQDRCENDDILVWITNMKISYCGRRTDFDDDRDQLLECVTNGKNCKIVDEEGKINTGATCIALFNKAPLILAGIVIWTIYFQLDNMIDLFKKFMPGNGGGGGAGGAPKEAEKDENPKKSKEESSGHGQDNPKSSGSQKGSGEPVQDPDPNTQSSHNIVGATTVDQTENGPKTTGNGKKDSNKNSESSNKTESYNKKGDTTGASSSQENSSEDDTKTESQDKTTKKSPSKTKRKGCKRPKGESESSNIDLPIQYFDVSCVLCKREFKGCFPDPLPMFCNACNPNDQPNSPPSTSSKEADPSADANNQSSSQPVTPSTEAVPNPREMTVWKCGHPTSAQHSIPVFLPKCSEPPFPHQSYFRRRRRT